MNVRLKDWLLDRLEVEVQVRAGGKKVIQGGKKVVVQGGGKEGDGAVGRLRGILPMDYYGNEKGVVEIMVAFNTLHN